MAVNNDNLVQAVQVGNELQAPNADSWLENIVDQVFHAHVAPDHDSELGQSAKKQRTE